MSITRVPIIRHGLTIWDRSLVPESEIEQRLQRIRHAMRNDDLDVLLVYGDQENSGGVAYLTNFHPFDARMPALAMVTATELDALLKVASRDLSYVSKYVWARCHSSDFLAGDLSAKLEELVVERKLGSSRAGFAGARHAPAALLQSVDGLFHGGGVSDADGIVANMRRSKSLAERTVLRLAAAKCESVLGELSRQVRPGLTEAGLAALADYHARKAGAQEIEFLVFTDDERAPKKWCREHFPFRPPAETPLHPGRSLALFLAIQYHGYWAEASQPAFVGQPGEREREAYQLGLACFEEMLLGATQSADDDHGWRDDVRYRWVHGTGLDREETPYASALGERAVLGDVLSGHVAVRYGGSVAILGRTVVASEAGGVLLATPTGLPLAPRSAQR